MILFEDEVIVGIYLVVVYIYFFDIFLIGIDLEKFNIVIEKYFKNYICNLRIDIYCI